MKEIIIIETQQGEKIKSLLDREQVSYLSSQDKEREKELREWDKITSKIDDE